MMKKILIFSFVVISASRSYSQASLDAINSMLEKHNYVGAKASIDKYIADPKNAEAANSWYFKGFVYNAYSKEASVQVAESFNYKTTAFDAFKKNQELDRLDLLMKSEAYRSYIDLYVGFYNLGEKQFNDKDFGGAYRSFSKAMEVEDFIVGKNYLYDDIKLNKTDTSLIINIGAAALQNQDTANGVRYYRKVTDAGIVTKETEGIYEFLAGYYRDKSDEANMQAMIAKGKSAYPTNKFWNELEIEKMSTSGDKTAMFAKYEEGFKADPGNFTNSFNYAVELYNSQYGKDAKPADPAMRAKLTEVLNAAVKNESAALEATGLLASHYYLWASDYSTEAALIKDDKTKPNDVKKKKELAALSSAKMDEAIPFGEKMVKYYSEMPTLTGKQKVNYQLYLNYLSDIYLTKNNSKKAAEYDKMRDAIKY